MHVEALRCGAVEALGEITFFITFLEGVADAPEAVLLPSRYHIPALE